MKDPFLAEKKAIEYIKSNPDGDKISFSDGFRYAEKLLNAQYKAENLPISGVSASTVKSLHTALTNLLQATDDEGWNNYGEDWEEQKEARKALAQVPEKYLR